MQMCLNRTNDRPARTRARIAAGWVNGVLAACLLMGGVTVSAQSPAEDYTPVTEEMLVDPPPGDWPMWRRTYNHWGHSPLAWAWTMAEGKQETTPLVALNVRTGEVEWDEPVGDWTV